MKRHEATTTDSDHKPNHHQSDHDDSRLGDEKRAKTCHDHHHHHHQQQQQLHLQNSPPPQPPLLPSPPGSQSVNCIMDRYYSPPASVYLDSLPLPPPALLPLGFDSSEDVHLHDGWRSVDPSPFSSEHSPTFKAATSTLPITEGGRGGGGEVGRDDIPPIKRILQSFRSSSHKQLQQQHPHHHHHIYQHPHHHHHRTYTTTSSSSSSTWSQPSSAAAGGGGSGIQPRYSFLSCCRGSTQQEELSTGSIVTPFAQILASLKKVRLNFMILTKASSTKDSRFGTTNSVSRIDENEEYENMNRNLAQETLNELEWCLEHLETVQTHRSVSDMASSKFKKLLSRELSHLADSSQSDHQISNYICSTFLDADLNNEEDDEEESNQLARNAAVAAAAAANNKSDDNTICPCNAGIPIVKLSPLEETEPCSLSSAETEASASDSVELRRPKAVVVSDHLPEGTTAATLEQHAAEHRASISLRNMPLTVVTGMERAVDLDDNYFCKFRYGVETPYEGQLSELLNAGIDNWGIDMFEAARLSNQRPLTAVTLTIFEKHHLLEKFSINRCTLARYLISLESHYYSDVPYHNSTHAADVTQSVHVLLSVPALEGVFSDLEVLAAIFACAIHDVNHPGVTNQYLINSGDPLALMYNDFSVLENHHLAVAFTLLKEKNCDIFLSLTKKQRQSLRRMAIDMVLATDMSKHMSLLADLKTMVETKKVAGSGVLNMDNYTDRLQILQNVVHCADLSNPTKPLAIYQQWIHRIMSEFFQQGDREKAASLDVSPMCDRSSASIEKTQISFIDYICHPLWETLADLLHPDIQSIFETLQENRDWFVQKLQDAEPSSSTTSTRAEPSSSSSLTSPSTLPPGNQSPQTAASME